MESIKNKVYDYDAQHWVADAPALEREMIEEDLDLLCSDRGAEYASFANLDRNATIMRLWARLVELST